MIDAQQNTKTLYLGNGLSTMKVIYLILLPWFSFFIGDYIYGSSHLMFHHLCEKTFLGCQELNFVSFAIKGLVCGSLACIVSRDKWEKVAFNLSIFSLLTIYTLGLICGHKILESLLDDYYWFTLITPFCLFTLISIKLIILIKFIYNKN